MGLAMRMSLLLMLSAIFFALVIQESAGYTIAPSPATFSAFPPIKEGRPALVHQGKTLRSNGPSPASQTNGSILHPPIVLPPSVPEPQIMKGLVPSLPPSTPTLLLPHSSAPPPSAVQETAPSMPPDAHHRKAPRDKTPVSVSVAPDVAPIVSPSKNLPQNSPTVHPVMPGSLPPSTHERKEPGNGAPLSAPVAPVGLPPRKFPQSPPAIQPIKPGVPPPILPVPVASPISTSSLKSPAIHPIMPGEPPSTLPVQETAPSMPPDAHHRKAPHDKTPVSVSVAPDVAPIASPSKNLPQNSPTVHPVMPGSLPPSTHERKAPENGAPLSAPVAPVGLPPRKFPKSPPAIQPIKPGVPAPILPVPVASPTSTSPLKSHAIHPIMHGEPPSTLPDPDISPISTPPPSINWKRDGMPVAAPPNETPNTLSPVNHPQSKGSFPVVAPSSHKAMKRSNDAPAQAPFLAYPKSPPYKRFHSPASSPLTSFYKRHHARNKVAGLAPASSYPVPSNASKQGPVIPPAPLHPPKFLPKNRQRHHTPPPLNPGSSVSPSHSPFPSSASHVSPAPSPFPRAPSGHTKSGSSISPSHSPFPSSASHVSPAPSPFPRAPSGHTKSGSSVSPSHSPFPSSASHVSPAPSPFPRAPSGHTKSVPFLSPKISPSRSLPRDPRMSPPPPVLSLPPPPPNEDCTSIVCTEPLTNTPPGSPCGCVYPMQVELRLNVALYTFFPLVSKLAEEIAAGVFMKQSQVRIVGANAASQQPEKTIVLIDLVPLGAKFDNTTAFLTYTRFWHKQVVIEASFFGDYEVLFVHYPGLPPSPPLAPSSIITDDGSYSDNDNARTIHPLGVDLRNRRHKRGLSGSVIAIIVLSASVAVVICSVGAWVLLVKCRDRVYRPMPTPQALLPSLARPSGIAGSMLGSGPSSVSLSFGSSIATYTGSAKTFSASEIEKATDKFNASRVIGEGGFGRVYSGVLEDGTKVAVKVLKRDDQQGGREFLAEVEMLSRLHHRNLVKLIGICTEDRTRCLVYELIPNGSVESHLHGVDKEASPLDWGARLKIALGAARGLAYLHEDSSPRVIHRDFKSSNILLEHDFTPKVSDFGLARTAMDEENRHITTRVMGTFGYVAPEYAMTGHLLVKSDVYSYGVVLLELLTGRKPVDMSQPPGQENLVTWARPLLTSKEGLEMIIDRSLGSDFPVDSVAKVAAIASMCVQPEVSHRPFMGEVVQALKLVCNECDNAKEVGSRSCSQEDLSIDLDTMRISAGSGQLPDTPQSQFPAPNYDSDLDAEGGLSAPDLFSASTRFGRQASGSFRRYSSSGPLRTGRRLQFWQRMNRLSGGSISEHGIIFRLWPGSH